MKEYFQKKEYKYMYLGSLSFSFANALLETFGTVMLYKNGIPIYLILLIYGLRFGITGICTPLFITLSNKLGVAKVILISNIFSIISAYMILNSNNIINNIIIFIFVIGLMGLSNPSTDALSSKYVDTEHRGRFNSFFSITKIIGVALASILVAWGVISKNDTPLFIIISIFFLLHYFFIRKVDFKPANRNNPFKSSIKYILESKSRYKIIYMLRANHIIERQFIPLYLFIILKDFKLFSEVIFLSLIFQLVTVSLIGKYLDKHLSEANTIVTVIKTIVTTIFLLFKNKVVISTNKMINDNFEKIYETSIQTSIQNIAKSEKNDKVLLSTVGQMCLCIVEVFTFIILSLISILIQEKIFYIIFILSIISSVLININIQSFKNRKSVNLQ